MPPRERWSSRLGQRLRACLRPRFVRVRLEQAVYGSFPFWDRGYGLLAHSPGCLAAWLVAFEAACRGFGQRPGWAAVRGPQFALSIARGPWMIVGVSESGADDKGRPGALAFHGLFIRHSDYRRCGAAPFTFEPFFRDAWEPQSGGLGPVDARIDPFDEFDHAEVDAGMAERARSIAEAIVRGERVVVESSEPANRLARAVWRAMPLRVRLRRSLATWVFSTQNPFDFLTLARPAATEPSPSGAPLLFEGADSGRWVEGFS